MKLIGKSTIHPFFFFSGKICGYITWILFPLAAFGFVDVTMTSFRPLRITSLVILIPALLLSILSLFNLGKSISLGLPEEKTVLKKSGLYRISRNPMYVGFNLLTMSSIIYTGNLYILLLGLYSVIVYHFIIMSEEVFLESRFGIEYTDYKKEVRRYL